VLLFEIVDVIWLSFKPVFAHASCVSSTLLATVKLVKHGSSKAIGVKNLGKILHIFPLAPVKIREEWSRCLKEKSSFTND